MTTVNATAPATPAPKRRKRKISVEIMPRDSLFGKLNKLCTALGRLLAPKYESAGIADLLKAAQEAVVKAGIEHVQKLPDDWAPVVKKAKRQPSPEQVAKLRERVEKLQAKLEAWEG